MYEINNKQPVNETVKKVIELFDWYNKELASGIISLFVEDLTYNYIYLMKLSKYYGLDTLIKDFFIYGNPKYSKYIKLKSDKQILHLKLDQLKEFIKNYDSYKQKHHILIKGTDI